MVGAPGQSVDDVWALIPTQHRYCLRNAGGEGAYLSVDTISGCTLGLSSNPEPHWIIEPVKPMQHGVFHIFASTCKDGKRRYLTRIDGTLALTTDVVTPWSIAVVGTAEHSVVPSTPPPLNSAQPLPSATPLTSPSATPLTSVQPLPSATPRSQTYAPTLTTVQPLPSATPRTPLSTAQPLPNATPRSQTPSATSVTQSIPRAPFTLASSPTGPRTVAFR